MTSIMVTGDFQKQAVQDLIDYSTEYPTSYEDLKKINAGEIPCAGDDPLHIMFIPLDIKVVYSHEEQKYKDKPIMCRHISVSVKTEGRYPHPRAVDAILEMFKFRGRLVDSSCSLHVWDDKEQQAINILEIISMEDEMSMLLDKET